MSPFLNCVPITKVVISVNKIFKIFYFIFICFTLFFFIFKIKNLITVLTEITVTSELFRFLALVETFFYKK